MLKKIIVLVPVLLIVATLYGQTVSVNKASAVAKNIYLRQCPDPGKFQGQIISPELVYTSSKNSENYYFVFNISQGGFVIVAANEAVPPVLGYSFQGRFLHNDLPPAVSHLLADYKEQVRLAIEAGLTATPQLSSLWNEMSATQFTLPKSDKSIAPMLHSTWDQGKYYNEFCPEDALGPDDHVWAGCVPTAMGQLMNYWRWPVHGDSSYTYIEPDYGTLSADFAATAYRWNEMPLTLTSYNSAIAELLFHLGVSVNLDYGPNGSGMFNHSAATALHTFFGYDTTTEYIFRDTAIHTNWKNLVLTHLDNNIPLYYAGWADTINVSGHAFVCDGYQDTTWFHFNWGWGGSYDGYFMLDDLTPSLNDFTLDHELILNLVPAGTYPAFCTEEDTLTAMGGTIGDGSGPHNNYMDNADCYWLIAPNDSVTNIKLTFKEIAVTGPGDHIKVYNGPTTASPLLGTYSGTTLPSVITANGQYMLIHFVSDAASNAAGWLAEYKTTLPVYCTGITTLTSTTGDIDDGSGNRDYHNNSTCRWKIEPVGVSSISLHISANEMGSGDFLEVYDQVSGSTLVHLTGDSIPDDIVCPSGKMLVYFKSDAKGTAAGFSANYYVTGSVAENSELTEIAVFPNPAKEDVSVTGTLIKSGKISLQLYNSGLSMVCEQTIESHAGGFSIPMHVGALAPGLYILRILTEKEQVLTKIVISK